MPVRRPASLPSLVESPTSPRRLDRCRSRCRYSAERHTRAGLGQERSDHSGPLAPTLDHSEHSRSGPTKYRVAEELSPQLSGEFLITPKSSPLLAGSQWHAHAYAYSWKAAQGLPACPCMPGVLRLPPWHLTARSPRSLARPAPRYRIFEARPRSSTRAASPSGVCFSCCPDLDAVWVSHPGQVGDRVSGP